MEFELKKVYQVGNIEDLGGTTRRMHFNYRGGDVEAPDDEKYYYREFSGHIDIDLNETGTSFETEMFNKATGLVAEKYPTI